MTLPRRILYALIGCGSLAAAVAAPPSGFFYNPAVILYCLGQPITPAVPTVTGTGVTYSIGPGQTTGAGVTPSLLLGPGVNLQGGQAFSLPAGLSFNPATGVISGTPTEAIPSTNYTVVAMNSEGSIPFTLGIGVSASCPTLSTDQFSPYATLCKNQFPGTTNLNLNNLVSVAPPLPAGLSLSGGALSGTPTVSAPSTNYTFTNGSGVSHTQNITVQNACQPLVIAGSGLHTLCAGQAITAIAYPVTSGGPIAQCAAAGLPSGFVMNPSSCSVTGATTASNLNGNFFVVSGFVSADHGIAYDTSIYSIHPCAPVGAIQYSAPDTLCLGQPMTPLTPVITGGTASSCSPQGLPYGLTLGPPPACQISGTPQSGAGPGTGTFSVTVTATVGGSPVQQTIPLIVKTCDPCANAWTVQQPALLNPPVTGQALHSIHFNHPVNHRVGHIVGSTGIIRFTDNDGADGWPAQNSGTIQELRSVTCSQVQTGYANGKCYASGTNGNILSSLDANTVGATWTPESCTGCAGVTLRALNCPSDCNSCGNAEFCLAVGDNGLIRRKTTAAGPWTAPTSSGGNTHSLYSVACKRRAGLSDVPASYNCYAVGHGGTLLKSTDGGDNWSLNTTYASAVNFTPSAATFYAASFNDENTGWVAGSGGILLHTSNGAGSAAGWSQLAPGVGTRNLYGLDTRWGSSLFTMGSGAALSFSHLPQNYSQLPGAYTTYAWAPQPNPAVYDLYSAFATDSCEAWVVGENGMILKMNTCMCSLPVAVTSGPEASRRAPRADFGMFENGALWYELSAPASVEVRLFDSRGREAARLFEPAGEAGLHVSLPVPGLRPGMYFLHARMGDGERKSRKAVFGSP